MKKDFLHLVVGGIGVLALSACGQIQATTDSVNTASAACSGSAIPKQYIVKHLDGSVKVIHAESDEALVNGYMKANAGTIDYAEHDFMVTAALPVQQETTNNTTTTADNWGVIKVEADKLWAQNVRGTGVVVAVVDTGMDLTHPQLQNQVFINSGESGLDSKGNAKSSNGVDDDSNGYIDDYIGYDFVPDQPQPLQGDYGYHGTHVSGIVAAAHQDTVAQSEPYVQGVAPGVKLLPLSFLGADGSGSMGHSVLAIQYAVKAGARVINASWGGPVCAQSLKDEITNLSAKNVIFVTAAGNDSADVDTSPSFPASLDLAAQITVGATGDHDYMAQYSNYGTKSVHIFAPGTNIVSTLPGGQMGFLSGTSMATPFVTGAVALLLSAMPEATADQIRSAIANSALHNPEYLNASQGRMDLAQALAQLHLILGH